MKLFPIFIYSWDFYFNTYYAMGKFSRWQTDDMFLIFPRKWDLAHHANLLIRRQFAWHVKSYVLEKKKKNIPKCYLVKFLPSMWSVEQNRITYKIRNYFRGMTSRNHIYIILTPPPPYTPPLYSKTGVYRGIYYFPYVYSKYRVWVLVRTALSRQF